MKIPASHNHAAARAVQPKPVPNAGPSVVARIRMGGPAPPRSDSVDVSSAGQQLSGTDNSRGQSPQQRIDNLLENVEARLGHMAQQYGLGEAEMMELRAAFSQFQSDLGRASEAAGDGFKGLGETIQSAMRVLGAETRSILAGSSDAATVSTVAAADPAASPDSTGAAERGSATAPDVAATDASADADASARVEDRASIQSRLENIQSEVTDRLRLIAGDLGPEGIANLRNASNAFAASIEELSAGLADGSLSLDDIRSGMQSAMQTVGAGARFALESDHSTTPPDASAVAGAGEAGPSSTHPQTAEQRVDTFGERLGNRLDNILSSLGLEGSPLADDISASFEQMMGRIETAFFAEGTAPMDQLGHALSTVIDTLRDELQGATASGPDVALYDAQQVRDVLAPSTAESGTLDERV